MCNVKVAEMKSDEMKEATQLGFVLYCSIWTWQLASSPDLSACMPTSDDVPACTPNTIACLFVWHGRPMALHYLAGLALKLALFPDAVSKSSRDAADQSQDDSIL